MNLSSILGSSTSGLSGSGSTSLQTAAVAASNSPQLAKAGQRIQSDVDATKAQLSQLGLLKSALADGQLSAKALSVLSAASSAAEVTTAMGGFFKTFNSSVKAAITASSAAGSAVVSSNARHVVQDLKTALRADPATASALKKLGLSVQSDGTLAQDAHKFASALSADPSGVRAALALVGKKVDAVNSAELAGNGTVATALANLNQHNTLLTAQQTALKTLQQAMAAYQTNSSAA
jgi:flagellar hook-associated protein 2